MNLLSPIRGKSSPRFFSHSHLHKNITQGSVLLRKRAWIGFTLPHWTVSFSCPFLCFFSLLTIFVTFFFSLKNICYILIKNNCIYLFLALLGLRCCSGYSPGVASGGHASLQCPGFSLWWLLSLWITGSRHVYHWLQLRGL